MNKNYTIEKLDLIHYQFVNEYDEKYLGKWHNGPSSCSFVEWLKKRIKNSSSFKKEIDEILNI